MCGITGFWSDVAEPDGIHHIQKMCNAIAHRGPDARGHWINPGKTVHFGHLRLSIVDLSEAGAQPMQSRCGRYQLVYNGEIYNHLDIRKELESRSQISWRGHSDTETILESISQLGFQKTLQKLNGMFAIALWDNKNNCLQLARDRLGEKPLYYAKHRNTILFSSELHAFKAYPRWVGKISDTSLDLFLRYSSVPAPLTIYEDVFKLQPAHTICINSCTDTLPASKTYWDISKIAEQSNNITTGQNVSEYLDNLEQKLLKAVRSRTMADVPVGSFLSGGIDSSLITALMQSQSSTPVKTFTIGFEENEYNEAPFAAKIAKHLQTDHTELYVTEKQGLDLVPKLGDLYDEPFADPSQIPTLLLSQLTAQHVKVSLSGDGGDELFYGYSRYTNAQELWGNISALPHAIRKPIAVTAHKIAKRLLRHSPSRFSSGATYQLRRVLALYEAVSSKEFELAYNSLLSISKDSPLMRPPTSPLIPDAFKTSNLRAIENKMMLMDMQCYLPDVVLTKVDRASMVHGLESRAPLLDHDLVEFAWQSPLDMKFRENKSKWALQQILHRYVPRELFERPKMGFGVPIDHWLRGALKEWSSDLLSDSNLANDGFFDKTKVHQLLREHQSGSAERHFQLWNILMFQSWLNNQRSST